MPLKCILNKNKYLNYLYLFIFISLVIIPVVLSPKYNMHLLLNGILFLVILMFLFNKENKYLFEPIYIFSLYYLTVPIVIWYYIYTDFKNNLFVQNIEFNQDFNFLFLLTVFFFFISYVMAITGYNMAKRNEIVCDIKMETKNKISDLSCNILSSIFIGIGLINFIYNLFKYANGNLLAYLLNMANRTSEFADGGTTLGYTIAGIGIFILLFKTLRDQNKRSSLIFLVNLLLVFIMKLSTGRIFNTLSFIGVIISVYYFMSISKNQKINNKPYIYIGMALIIIAITLYFFRMMGALNEANQLTNSVGSYFKNFINQIGYYAIDKGNMPNIAIMPKIIDSWGSDIGYLHGSSLITWTISALPSSLGIDIMYPAEMVKEFWYSNIPSGNLPITLIGELYANFCWLGPIVGMFLFGGLITFLFDFTMKKKNYWLLIILMDITIGFIALSPKGEINNLSLWMIVPHVFSYFILIFLTKLQHFFVEKKEKKKC